MMAIHFRNLGCDGLGVLRGCVAIRYVSIMTVCMWLSVTNWPPHPTSRYYGGWSCQAHKLYSARQFNFVCLFVFNFASNAINWPVAQFSTQPIQRSSWTPRRVVWCGPVMREKKHNALAELSTNASAIL